MAAGLLLNYLFFQFNLILIVWARLPNTDIYFNYYNCEIVELLKWPPTLMFKTQIPTNIKKRKHQIILFCFSCRIHQQHRGGCLDLQGWISNWTRVGKEGGGVRVGRGFFICNIHTSVCEFTKLDFLFLILSKYFFFLNKSWIIQETAF